jgi:transcriptional regulator with XRE-family HTH domain
MLGATRLTEYLVDLVDVAATSEGFERDFDAPLKATCGMSGDKNLKTDRNSRRGGSSPSPRQGERQLIYTQSLLHLGSTPMRFQLLLSFTLCPWYSRFTWLRFYEIPCLVLREGLVIERFVGRRIKQERERRELRQRDVAAMAGIPRSTYASIENGEYVATISRLAGILKALDLDIEDVWPAAAGEGTLCLDRSGAFRFREVILLSGASAGVLVLSRGNKCEVLHSLKSSEEELGELCRSIAGRGPKPLAWRLVPKRQAGCSLHLCLKDTKPPDWVPGLIEHYLTLWIADRMKS